MQFNDSKAPSMPGTESKAAPPITDSNGRAPMKLPPPSKGRVPMKGPPPSNGSAAMNLPPPVRNGSYRPTAVKSAGKSMMAKNMQPNDSGDRSKSGSLELGSSSAPGKAPITKVPPTELGISSAPGKAPISKVPGKAPITKVPGKAPITKVPPGKAP